MLKRGVGLTMSLRPSRFGTALLPARRGEEVAAPVADSPSLYPAAPPLLDCCHCGVKIELRMWPPLEPVLTGPCPGCGGWLSVDFRTVPRREAENIPAHDTELEAPEKNDNRITRTGVYQPQFLPDLARAGLLPERPGPDFEARDTSRDRIWTSSQSDRWMKALAIVVTLAVLTGGSFVLGQYFRSQPGLTKPAVYKPLPPDHGPETVPMPDEMVAEARQALAALAAARTPQEVLPWVLDPDRIAKQVERYYHQGVTEPALDAKQFGARPVSLRDRAQGIAVLGRMSENGKPLVVFLKRDLTEMNPRYRLDWETYIQEKEGLLPKFVADDTEREAIFRVVLRREHLFGEDDLRSGRLGVGLGTINGLRLERPAVISPIDKLFPRLDFQLSWSQPQLATVKLAWSRYGNGEKTRLTISQFLCWELAGVGGVPESPLAPALTLAGAR
jgi:hypothetical protein